MTLNRRRRRGHPCLRHQQQRKDHTCLLASTTTTPVKILRRRLVTTCSRRHDNTATTLTNKTMAVTPTILVPTMTAVFTTASITTTRQSPTVLCLRPQNGLLSQDPFGCRKGPEKVGPSLLVAVGSITTSTATNLFQHRLIPPTTAKERL